MKDSGSGEHHIVCTPELISRHEEMIVTNKIILEQFIERYDKDRQECAARYKQDREESTKWRESFYTKLEKIESFLDELKPNYNRSLYFAGILILGAFGLVFKIIWSHVSK